MGATHLTALLFPARLVVLAAARPLALHVARVVGKVERIAPAQPLLLSLLLLAPHRLRSSVGRSCIRALRIRALRFRTLHTVGLRPRLRLLPVLVAEGADEPQGPVPEDDERDEAAEDGAEHDRVDLDHPTLLYSNAHSLKREPSCSKPINRVSCAFVFADDGGALDRPAPP